MKKARSAGLICGVLLLASAAAPAGPRVGAEGDEAEASAYLAIRRLLGSGQPAAAVGEARKAMERYPGSCRVHEALVQAYEALGDAPGAVRDLRDRLEADPDNGCLHYGLGLAHLNVKDNEAALASLRRARSLLPSFALICRELAFAHRQRGTLEAGAAEFEAELAADPARASSHYGLGFVHNFGGDTTKAAFHLERALALDPGLLDAYRYLGQIRFNRGELEASLLLGRELLRRAEAESDLLYEAFASNGLGAASLRLARYAQAVGYYQDALTVQQELGDRQGQWATLNGLGVIYDNLGEAQKALGFHERALAVSRTIDNERWTATTLHNIGVTHGHAGDLLAAQRYYGQALAIRTRIEDRRGRAYTLTDLGVSYVREGRLADGLRYLEEAATAAAGIDDSFLQAAIETARGDALERGATLREAEGHYARALEIADRTEQREIVWRARQGLGALRRKEGRLAEAVQEYASAIEAIESIRQEVQEEAARTVFLAGKMAPYEGIVDVLERLHQRLPRMGYDRQALEYAQKAKARAFLDLLAEARAEVHKGMTPEQFEEERSILRETARLHRRFFQGSVNETQRSALKAELTAVEGRLEAFKDELRRKSPAYAELRYPAPEPLDKLAAELLDRDTLLVEFMVATERSYAWLVSGKGVEATAVLPGAKALEREVERYRRLAFRPPTGKDTVEQASRLGRELYRTLLAPFGARLLRAKRLVIVPDGVLHYLPMESLVTSVDASGRPRYLLEAHDVAYAPSASVLASLDRRPPSAGALALLAYGAPRLARAAVPAGFPGVDRRAGEVLRALPHAGQEVQSIARMFPERLRRVRLGDGASEGALKSEDLAQFRILHLATHGLLDDRSPARSGLLLAPGNAEEDGLLQGPEILNLDLDADLVVLSACETGLGRLVRGEGLVGLSRAFFYAGARTVVVSLWSVDDASTAAVMTAFYRRLRQGQGKAAALREAKREMLRSDRPAYRLPYYWAPFVLVGRPD